MRLLSLLLCAALAAAADNAAVQAYQKAMAGDDPYAKRDALKALGQKGAADDDTAIPLLVKAVADRQAAEFAIEALRTRCGLTKPFRLGGTHYPGYPNSDSAADWQVWLDERSKEVEAKRKLNEIKNKVDNRVPDGTGAGTTTAPTPAPAPAPGAGEVVPPAPIPTDDLGKLDRIVYKSGRTVVAYVRAERFDGDNNLVSVRIVHPDGAGEEVIDASVIARIEKDIE